jgi:hypothetical protein
MERSSIRYGFETDQIPTSQTWFVEGYLRKIEKTSVNFDGHAQFPLTPVDE